MSDKLNAINTITNYIKNGILSGTWKIGDKIPSELDICNELGVERSCVRSALSQYASMGLLKSIHGKGTFVCSTCTTYLGSGSSPTSMIEAIRPLLEFRHMFEPEVCYRATLSCTNELILTLEAILTNMRDSVNDVQKSVNYDMCFHLSIAKSLNNTILEETLSNILLKNVSYFLILNQSLGAYNGIYYHNEIFHAIKAKDAKKARSLMSEHLEKAIFELK